MQKRTHLAFLNFNGATALLVQVPSFVIHNAPEANRYVAEYSAAFPDAATVILTGMAGPRPTYFGDPHYIRQLRQLPQFRIHWQEHTRSDEPAKPSSASSAENAKERPQSR